MPEKVTALRALFPAGMRRKLPTEIYVTMIREPVSQCLNRRYRKKDKPTNILSFRYGPAYGELLLCRPVIQREARNQGNALQTQMTWMIIHGMLHLAGVHHEKSQAAAKRVARIEEKVFRKFQLV